VRRTQNGARMSFEHQADCEAFVNEAYRDVAHDLRLDYLRADITLTAGQSDYSIRTPTSAGGLGIPNFLRFDQQPTYTLLGSGQAVNPMPQITPTAIIESRRTPASITSWSIAAYALFGPDIMAIYPTPQSADTLGVSALLEVPEMTSDDDTPDMLPANFHELIFFRAVSRACAEAPQLAVPARLTAVTGYDGLYDKLMLKAYAWRRRLGGDSGPEMTTQQRRVLPPRDPSTYWSGATPDGGY